MDTGAEMILSLEIVILFHIIWELDKKLEILILTGGISFILSEK
jgi:hypothetical protein